MRQLLLDGGDASWVMTMDHILDPIWKNQVLLGNDLANLLSLLDLWHSLKTE